MAKGVRVTLNHKFLGRLAYFPPVQRDLERRANRVTDEGQRTGPVDTAEYIENIVTEKIKNSPSWASIAKANHSRFVEWGSITIEAHYTMTKAANAASGRSKAK